MSKTCTIHRKIHVRIRTYDTKNRTCHEIMNDVSLPQIGVVRVRHPFPSALFYRCMFQFFREGTFITKSDWETQTQFTFGAALGYDLLSFYASRCKLHAPELSEMLGWQARA